MKPVPIRNSTAILILSCWAGALLSPLAADDKVLLKTVYAPGKVYTVTQTLNQDMTMEGQGKTNTDISMVFGLKAMEGETAGETKLAMDFQKIDILMNMRMGEQAVVIDTKDENNPQAQAIRQQIKPLMDAEIVAIHGKDGELKEVTGIDAEKYPMLKQFAGKEMFSQTLGQDKMLSFPKDPVGKGDKWKIDTTQDITGIKMRLTGEAIVEDVQQVDGHDVATLAIDAEMELDMATMRKKIADQAEEKAEAGEPIDKAKTEGLMPKITKMTMKLKLKFDATDGLTTSANIDSDMEMSMQPPGEPKPLEIKMKQKAVTTTTMDDAK